MTLMATITMTSITFNANITNLLLESGTLLGPYSGITTPEDILSSGTSLTVTFTTDLYKNTEDGLNGFVANYQTGKY